MSENYIGLVIWSLGCVSALAASWLADRREDRESTKRYREAMDLVQTKINDLGQRASVLENKVDECLRRVDRP